jgi:hypothetical protein
MLIGTARNRLQLCQTMDRCRWGDHRRRAYCAQAMNDHVVPITGLGTAHSRWGETRFTESKTNAMHTETAGNQNYDDHCANDSKYIHSNLLPLHDDGAAGSHASIRRYSHCYRQRLNPQYPPPPNSRKSTRTIRMTSMFSSKLAGISPSCTCRRGIYCLPASECA